MTFTIINALLSGVLAVAFFGFHGQRVLAPALLALAATLLAVAIAVEWLFAGNAPGAVLRLDGRIAAASASSVGASAGMFVAAILNLVISRRKQREP